MAEMCQGCKERPAQVCDECRRACALKSFSGISRHPESGEGCLVCEDGPPRWCGSCWAQAVHDYRDSLREHPGRDIGHWPDYPAMRLGEKYGEDMMRVGAQRAKVLPEEVDLLLAYWSELFAEFTDVTVSTKLHLDDGPDADEAGLPYVAMTIAGATADQQLRLLTFWDQTHTGLRIVTTFTDEQAAPERG